ncbi:MAG: CHASE2 domain-containing protein, partial [Burkholderiaceae bacterium]
MKRPLGMQAIQLALSRMDGAEAHGLSQPIAGSDSISRRHRVIAWLIGLSMALALGWAAQSTSAFMAGPDRALYDALLARTATGHGAAHTAVVDIDEISLAAAGQWPWPRYRVAELLKRVAAEQPRAIALDIIFPEADRSSLLNIKQTFKRDFGVELSIGGVPDALLDNDGYFGSEMARTDAIGARYFLFDHVTADSAPLRPGVGFDGRLDLLTLDDAPGVLENAAPIASQTRLTGFFNAQPDEDGVLRRMPLLIRHQGVVHGSLALIAGMRALGAATATVERGPAGLALNVAGHRLPIDARGRALLRYEGDSSLVPAVSAVQVLSGQMKRGTLTGKVVFIGSSVAGLKDVQVTPVDARFPGVKTHAVLVQSLLNDRQVAVPPWRNAAVMAACLAVAALLTAMYVGGASVALLAGGSVLLGGAAFGLTLGAWMIADLFISAFAPALLAAVLFSLAFTARFFREQQRAVKWQRQLEHARQVTIESMASVAETRDPETGAHIKRTQHYVRAIAEHLRRTSARHGPVLSANYIDLLFVSAPLHDIGKVGVPDHILLKPGRLTPDEMTIMKQHAEFGRRIILSASTHIHGDNFLVIAGDIAATHHEKWDGSGYPLGLSGQAIPLAGRIMAVADVYDALISRRCYKEPFTHAHAMSLMLEMRGSAFDPEVYDAFMAIEARILEIAGEFRDEDGPSKHVAPIAAP